MCHSGSKVEINSQSRKNSFSKSLCTYPQHSSGKGEMLAFSSGFLTRTSPTRTLPGWTVPWHVQSHINPMNIFKSLLSADRCSLSSKRLCGIIGWLCSSAVLIMCTVWDRQAPDMVSTIIYASTAMLGIDSVTDIWKTNSTSKSEDNEK